jgi:pilus assembly protein CpaF
MTTHQTVVFGQRRPPRFVLHPPAAVVPRESPTATAADVPPPDRAIGELRTLCLARLDPAVVASTPEAQLLPQIEKLISEMATERRVQLNGREQLQLAGDLVHDMLGLGPLEPLIDDETINDILVNGPDKIFVERRGKLELSNARFRDTEHLVNVCHRIAADIGRHVDESSPMVDARLKDGSRVNIVLAPIALDGPYVSIRKFGHKVIDLAKLIGWGAMTPPVARVLEIAARCRLNIIISGGTGSGKTTLLNALSQMIAPTERIVTVEDAAELKLQQPHVVRMETRPANLEEKGEITQRDLVRNALRMRPDRIIIGEVRGAEAFDMLQAMNTGHDGSMSTIHANTARDALTRMENMVQMGHLGLPSLVAVDPHANRQRRPTDRADRAAARRRPPGHSGGGSLRHGSRDGAAERGLPFQRRCRRRRRRARRPLLGQRVAAGVLHAPAVFRPGA